MSLDAESLTNTMIRAARDAVSERWPAVKALAEVELRRLAQSLVDVKALVVSGQIDHASAQKLVQIHQMTVRSVLMQAKGIGLATAERVTFTAADAVTDIVNHVVGFKLL